MRKNRSKKGKKLHLCFVDYQKAFDRVKHDKLIEVMEKAGIPELEMRLIMNLYWHQKASVRWGGRRKQRIQGGDRGETRMQNITTTLQSLQ